jgi:diaminopimelate epimerase
MQHTQFYGNTFLFINKNAQEFSLPKESKDIDLTMYYEYVGNIEEIKEYRCTFFNKDGSEASLCGNALLRLMEQEGNGEYLFRTISGEYYGWNNKNELAIKMQNANIQYRKSPISSYSYCVDIGNIHIINIATGHYQYKRLLAEYSAVNTHYNMHLVKKESTHYYTVHCFERGVGETQACGSGAYAVGIAMIEHFQLNEVYIVMKGGTYKVREGYLIVEKKD